jgi:hypothetical protein
LISVSPGRTIYAQFPLESFKFSPPQTPQSSNLSPLLHTPSHPTSIPDFVLNQTKFSASQVAWVLNRVSEQPVKPKILLGEVQNLVLMLDVMVYVIADLN